MKMKKLNQLRAFNRAINTAIFWWLISLVVIVFVISLCNLAISIVVAFLYLMVTMLLVSAKIMVYLGRYDIMYKELAQLVYSEIEECASEVSVYCSVSEKKNYSLINLKIKGKLETSRYSQIAIKVNEYLRTVENVMDTEFVLNMTKTD